MTILNLEKTTEYLVDWLVDQLESAGLRSCVVGVSGGVDSALTLAIAARAAAKRDGKCVGVLMPCHSSENSTLRGIETIAAVAGAAKLPIHEHRVVLNAAFADIAGQVGVYFSDEKKQRFTEGALRSCLRAPVLDYVAKCYGGLVVGTGNRDEDEIFRYYQKRGDGAVDNNPLCALHKSEVYQLAAHLGVPQSVLQAPPSADLWGPDAGQTDEGELGISYAEIEWLTREDDEYGVVFDVVAELGDTTFDDILALAEKTRKAQYTERELFLIQEGIRAYKSTLHKAELPYAPRRSNMVHDGLLC